MATASDIASLMQNAGFTLPTIDVEKIKIGMSFSKTVS
jgi:hypothetical protein